MHTIRKRLCFCTLLHTTYRFCYSLISQQHKLLDKLVCITRGLEVCLYRLALLVDIEMQFLTIELHRTVLESCCTQFLCEGIEFDKLLCILTLIRILLRCWGSRLTSTILNTIVLEYLLYLLIGIATITLNDSMCQMPLLDICLIVELEDHTITEFLLIRTQRTDKVT